MRRVENKGSLAKTSSAIVHCAPNSGPSSMIKTKILTVGDVESQLVLKAARDQTSA